MPITRGSSSGQNPEGEGNQRVTAREGVSTTDNPDVFAGEEGGPNFDEAQVTRQTLTPTEFPPPGVPSKHVTWLGEKRGLARQGEHVDINVPTDGSEKPDPEGADADYNPRADVTSGAHTVAPIGTGMKDDGTPEVPMHVGGRTYHFVRGQRRAVAAEHVDFLVNHPRLRFRVESEGA